MPERVSPWRGKRVLVTGCTGLLGGAVARELCALGAEVVAVIQERPAPGGLAHELGGAARFVHGRVDNVFRLHSAMAVHEVVAIFHLLPEEVRATKTVREAANLYSRRVPVVTARPHKTLALAQADAPSEDRISAVRFGEVFGPGDCEPTHVVPATAASLLGGAGASLPADGPARDFIFALDAARACILAAEAVAQGGPADYSFFSGWRMTDRQMAAALREVHAGRPVEAPDSAPPANPLGWRPAHTLAESLHETLAWHCEAMRTASPQGERAAA